MARSFEIDAALVAMSWSMIDEGRQLLASLRSDRASLNSRVLLTKSRALIADSRQLLAMLEHTPLQLTPIHSFGGEAAEAGTGDKQRLSVCVFQKGSVFGWTLSDPDNRTLGLGTAATELKARIDAFGAGMTYMDRSNIDRSKNRRAHNDTRLH